ncbi:hypothetical protein DH2020_007877 [Rehmannia glutinosa]|uniref:VHS domain-containing protein n=1 Tax=Rehmannia glutinosa TaxID=99300 RepID=A0ABR0TZD6_REHGL
METWIYTMEKEKQAKDALNILKKKLGNKNPEIQLLALFVLETLSKNCGENVLQQVVELDILHEMVNIVMKKPDLHVREKILTLIDTWQEALGGPMGRFPQYHAAYNELKSAGIEFPPREENSVPLFTPPQSRPIAHGTSPYEEVAVRTSSESDASGLSLPEIQNAEGLADVLMEMLAALDPNNSQGVKDEIIVDLVDQCRSYQKRVMNLQVLRRHDDIANGTPAVSVASRETPVAPLMNVNREDEDSEDGFARLAHRSSTDATQGLLHKPAVVKIELPVQINRILPPPPSSRKPISIDYLSGDVYETKQSSETSSESTNTSGPKTTCDEAVLTSKSADQLPSAPYDVVATRDLSPPPSGFTQIGGPSHSSISYDSLVGQTQNLSIKSPGPTEQEKPEDALFKDLVDFAKAKSSSAKPYR